MLNKIISFSIQQKLIIGIFILFLIGYGSYQVTQLPIDAVPDITNNQVQIITSAPSLGATDIERLVTFPVEQANSNIPGLIELRSFSRFGLSVVSLVFEDAVDVYWARQQVQERLQEVKESIPKGIGNPVLTPVSTGLGEIYQYVVRNKKGHEGQYTDTELRTIQDWIVRRDLLRVKGVADVSSFGGKLKQYEIAVDPNQLNAFGITIDDVFDAIDKNNENTGGAYIEKQASVLFIRTEGLLSSQKEIESIPVKLNSNGIPLLIKDVAEVKIGHAIRYGALTYNGEGEVAGAIVMMIKGGNSSKIIKGVKSKIAEIQKTLPEGVVIEPFLDRTKMVNNAINTVQTNLLEGALIVVFILVLFLGNFRAGLLVASVIPLAMLFAIIMMNLFGVSGNLMSLGALDFGLIIDGAVIIVEATLHQLSRRENRHGLKLYTQSEMDGIVKGSASKMMNSAVFGQIVILVVYLPIFSLQGIEGKMFKPMAQTVAFALIGAFILSLTYIPMMSALFLSKKANAKKTYSDKMIEVLERFYQKYLSKALKKPLLVLSVVVLLFTIAIFSLTRLGGEFIPTLEEGDFAVETRVLTGTSLQGSIDATLKAEKVLLDKFPEVIKVVGKTGSGEIPTDPMPMEATDLMIILKNKEEWVSATNFNDLAEKMKKELKVIPGVTFGFQYPVQMRFNELMTGARQDIVCKIYGENLDTLAKYANQFGKVVQQIEGAEDLYVESVTGMPQIVIDYDRGTLAQYGVDVRSVNRQVNAAFAGQQAGLIYEGEKRFDLVVRLDKSKRDNLKDVQNLLISTPDGQQVPLYVFAKVEIVEGPNQIQRENTKRRIIVGFNARGRDVQSLMEELNNKVNTKISLPTGYNVEYGGSFKNLEHAKNRLSIAVPIALLLIFILLYFAFRSVKQGLLIFTAIPLSAIGGIFALSILDLPFSISAGVGFIALFGVAVLNGIVLIAEFNRLKKEGMKNLRRIVLMGTKIRMRPVLMTAFVASLGFLPMAMSQGAGAEVQRPLASVVIGGLLLATFLTLFVLPILYVLFTDNRKPKKEMTHITVVLLLFFGINFSVSAQTPISYQEAIDSAFTNNLQLKGEGLKSIYQEEFIKTSNGLPLTDFGFQYGRINSFYLDNNFSISQSLEFPTVYSNKKKVNVALAEKSKLNVKLKEAELKQQVGHSFYYILNLLQKKALLKEVDSIYEVYLKNVNLKIEVGESNVLEKVAIENQRLQIANQLKWLVEDIEVNKSYFKVLLNTKSDFTPVSEDKIITVDQKAEVINVEGHPQVRLFTKDIEIAKAKLQLEKAKRAPSISLGVNSMSMFGAGSNNLTYEYSTRFNSAQIGLGIPIFSKQSKQVKLAEINAVIAENNLNAGEQQIRNQIDVFLKQYAIQKEIVEAYRQTALSNATTILEVADQQLKNGEIDYLEWAQLINQTVGIKSNYLNEVLKLNEISLQLIYLADTL